ncbi:MAG TPA: putative toxin-antitoxin system toxin component, PIN family [Candidatus Acidoferrales bacterium]|nr:putative toxin-antitoxin system toxin component, PIN family [Candidatus Acidoferrales bacterium]
MRVVLDTNILVSALIASSGNPAAIVNAWLDGRFTLLTCAEHVDELRGTLEKPRLAALIKPHKAGRLVNQIKKLAEDVGTLPDVELSSDPADDFLLAMCEAGTADYLVTGTSGLLTLRNHGAARIVSASDFAAIFALAKKRHK